jgi:hypothetical protein
MATNGKKEAHMPESNEYSVMALTQAFVAEDLSSVEIHLAVVGKPPLVLTISPSSLAQIVTRLTDLNSAVQIRIGSTTGHVETPAADVQAVMAQEAVGGSKVIVSMRTNTGIQSFALSLEQAQQLRADARKAEAKVREQASKARN